MEFVLLKHQHVSRDLDIVEDFLNKNTIAEITARYSISKSRMYQIIQLHKQRFIYAFIHVDKDATIDKKIIRISATAADMLAHNEAWLALAVKYRTHPIYIAYLNEPRSQ